MSVRPIVLLGDPRLRLKGLPVETFGTLVSAINELQLAIRSLEKAQGQSGK